ncbi:MAG: DedA family protein [Gemmatimonadota bacterium]|nr:DedA family protein [Gemmatimonadota bacterium]
MLQWIASLVGAFGYSGVGLLMAMQNIVLPMPSELIMPLAGFETGAGHMTLLGVIIAGTIGSVLGALPVYAFARSVGEKRISSWLDAHGHWILVTGTELRRADARFKRHGVLAVAVSQLLPGARGLISLPAGIAKMNVALFILANIAGTIIWCTVLAIAGHMLGVHFTQVDNLLGPIGWIIIGAIVLLLIAVPVLMRRRRHLRR